MQGTDSSQAIASYLLEFTVAAIVVIALVLSSYLLSIPTAAIAATLTIVEQTRASIVAATTAVITAAIYCFGASSAQQ